MVQKDDEGNLVNKAKPAKINAMLEVYRERGVIDHKKTLAIPFDQRIPELVKQPNGRLAVSVALSSSILSAFKHIEKAKMDAEQIVELAEGIIDSSHEDQLAIEDVLLFLKELLLGKYGKVSEKVDMPCFFQYLEKYRDERYRLLEAVRYEQHLQSKNMGHAPRSYDEINLKRNDDPGTMIDLMQSYYSTDEK